MIFNVRSIMPVIILWLGVSGCSGQLYTVENAKPLPCCEDQGQYYEGIRFHGLTNMVEIWDYTARVNEAGEVVAYLNAKDPNIRCELDHYIARTTEPDYSKPYQLVYKPGFLETNAFGVELKDGLLVKINTSSVPDRGETFSKIASTALQGMKSFAQNANQSFQRNVKPCNARLRLRYKNRYDEACPDGNCKPMWDEYWGVLTQ